MARRRKQLIGPARRRRMAEHLALVVLALQVAVVVMLAVTDSELPPRVGLMELLWAAARRPSFYPLAAVLVAGPVLTVVACWVAGRHRAWLAMAWPVFLLVLMVGYGERVALMVRILWEQSM